MDLFSQDLTHKTTDRTTIILTDRTTTILGPPIFQQHLNIGLLMQTQQQQHLKLTSLHSGKLLNDISLL